MVTGEPKRPLPPLWYEGYPGARQNKLCSLSRYLRFDELCRVLESYGYTMNASKSGSGHYTFRKPGCRPITIPKHESVLRIFAFQKRRGAWQISLRAWQHNGNKNQMAETLWIEEMQKYLNQQAREGKNESEAYRNLMEVLGIEFPMTQEKDKKN